MPCVAFNAHSVLYLFKSGLLVVCFSDPSDGVDPTGVRRGGVLSRQFCQPAQHGGLHPGRLQVRGEGHAAAGQSGVLLHSPPPLP